MGRAFLLLAAVGLKRGREREGGELEREKGRATIFFLERKEEEEERVQARVRFLVVFPFD